MFISYDDRVIDLPSEFSLINPYHNKECGSSELELFLDNNALVRADKWVGEIDRKRFSCVHVDLENALVEQYFSNQHFRDNVVEKINSYINVFQGAGILFEKDFADKQSRILKDKERGNRFQLMLSYLYVVLLYRITFARRGDNKPFELLENMKCKNVPCFSALVMLCSLAKVLNQKQNIKMKGDFNTAYSYLSKFLDLSGTKKGESELGEKYFRNRGADLLLWLGIPQRIQNGYQPTGEIMIVTKDNALRKLIFRCFPFEWMDDGKMAVSFDYRVFETEDAEKIYSEIRQNCWQFREPKSWKEKFERLENLKEHVLEGVDEDIKNEVEQVWCGWMEPIREEFITADV